MSESSEYFTRGIVLEPEQSFVWSVKRTGERTMHWGEPVEEGFEGERACWKWTA